MVTCTTPPFRAAVRLNSGVRRHAQHLRGPTLPIQRTGGGHIRRRACLDEDFFCNGAGYCVKIETTPDNGLGSVSLSRNGVDIDIPNLGVVKGEPDLRFVRLVSLADANGYSNRLEIPFFGKNAKRLDIHIKDDKVDAIDFVEPPADDV